MTCELSEIDVDNFAGGGGASTGLEAATGRPVTIAVNHSEAAIAMHRINHPETKHYREDVWEVDPKEATNGRRIRVLWLSPDCTHHSRAAGGKPRERGVRGLAWVAIRWARLPKPQRPRVILLENVEEFEDWGPLDDGGHPIVERKGETFLAFVSSLRSFGYSVEWRRIVAADHGAPTSRRRLFLVARSDGKPIVWPEATHGPGRERPWRTAAEIIDWSIPTRSIFGRKKPLAEATLKRIAAGLRRYVIESADPFIAPLTHHGDRRAHPMHEPMPTVTAANRGELALVTPYVMTNTTGHPGRPAVDPLPTITTGGHHALVAPTLVQTGYGERPGQSPRAMDIGRPLGTIVSGGKHAMVSAFLAKHYGGVVGQELPRAIGTVTAKDHHSLVTAHLEKFYGTAEGADVRAPLPTVTAAGNHVAEVRAFLVAYYGSERDGQTLGDPMRTVPTKDRFGLVTVHGIPYEIVDIGLRMLQPRELFNAQGFPADYVIDFDFNGKPITKTAQIELCGNSVCPPAAEALAGANLWDRYERRAA